MPKEKTDKLEKLKARGYDLLAIREQADRELQQVNAQIQKMNQETKPKKEGK